MILLDRRRRPCLVWLMVVVFGDNRCWPASTSGGKEMARGTSREDTLAELSEASVTGVLGGQRGRRQVFNERRDKSSPSRKGGIEEEEKKSGTGEVLDFPAQRRSRDKNRKTTKEEEKAMFGYTVGQHSMYAKSRPNLCSIKRRTTLTDNRRS